MLRIVTSPRAIQRRYLCPNASNKAKRWRRGCREEDNYREGCDGFLTAFFVLI